MAKRLRRGDICWLDLPSPDKPRPVVVLSRNSLLDVLHTATVAAITSTVRGAPTEVAMGPEEGLQQACCVNLCNLFTVRQSALRERIGSASTGKMRQICRALVLASACE